MPKQQSDDSDYDSQQENEKFLYKKPQVSRLDRFKNLKKIVINLSTTQYSVVTDIAEDLGWKVQTSMDAGDWDVYWTDIPIDTDTLIKMHLFQKINYYPGIHTLARKNLLGMNLMNMKERFPNDYNFFPLTWMLPQQYVQFRQYYENKKQRKTRTYIVKPEAECQGRGIFLTRNIQDLQNGKHYVVQRYIAKPYLMEGLKFDLRIYVLLCGTNPLRLYIFQDGLARFATQKYVQPTNQNLERQYMHLTNYAINKKSPKFVFNNSSTNMGIGHKRSLKCIYEQMGKKGVNIQVLKQKINDLIVKTIIAGLPLMSHQYKCCQPEDYSNNMCFHIIGFDVMLDHKEEPQLIQINHTPSFATDTPLDYNIKFNLIKDTLKLMHITSKKKNILFTRAKQSNQARLHAKKRLILDGPQRQARITEEQRLRDDYESKHLGGYTKIYPLTQKDQEKTKRYESLIQGAYKMHYAENTPIRIKLQEAQKQKQIEQDMRKIKNIQQSQKKKTLKDPTAQFSRIKKTNTTQQRVKDIIQSLNDNNMMKAHTCRQNKHQKSNNHKQPKRGEQSQQQPASQQQPTIQQQPSSQQQPASQQQAESQTHSKSSSGEGNKQKPQSNQSLYRNRGQLHRPQCFIDIQCNVPNKVISTSDMNNSSSQSTGITKNQEQKLDQTVSINKMSSGKLTEKLTSTNITGYPKIVTSVEKQLIRKQSQQIKNSSKFANLSDRNLIKKKQKISLHEQIPQSCKQILADIFIRQKAQASVEKRKKHPKEAQLPNIYDVSPEIGGQEIRKSYNYKKKSSTKNSKILDSIGQDMKLIIQNRSRRKRNDLQSKNNEMSEMNRLVSRKINFSHLKGNYNSPHLSNNIPTAIGPGGFVIPKMYHLSVQSQKKIQVSQNLIAIMSRKNVGKLIFPL